MVTTASVPIAKNQQGEERGRRCSQAPAPVRARTRRSRNPGDRNSHPDHITTASTMISAGRPLGARCNQVEERGSRRGAYERMAAAFAERKWSDQWPIRIETSAIRETDHHADQTRNSNTG
jgi:hypothetical protein